MRQAAILKRVVQELVHADFVVVDSRDAAMAALMARVPDVLLVTTLLSPRDEEELFSHLRARDGADHVQTHTIPLLASTRADEESESGGGLFGKFRRKKEAPRSTAGCDPDLFADQIRTFIAAAQELKSRPSQAPRRAGQRGADSRPAAGTAAPAPAADEPAHAGAGSAWASPFEWRPTSSTPSAAPKAHVSAYPSPGTVPSGAGGDIEAQQHEAQAQRERREADERRQQEEAERQRLEAEAAETREREEAQSRERAEEEGEARTGSARGGRP